MKKNRWMLVCAAVVWGMIAAGCSDDAASKFPMHSACGDEVCQEDQVCVEETCVSKTPEDQNDPVDPDDQNAPVDPDDQKDLIKVTCDTTSVTENGDKISTCSVVLTSQPDADVVITVEVKDDTELDVSETAMTFTSENWDQPKIVSIRGKEDHVVDGNQTTDVVFGMTSDDPKFNTKEDEKTVLSITTVDNDAPGVTITTKGEAVLTGASSAYVDVVLNQRPDGDVTITLTTSNEQTVNPQTTTLTFTPDDWNVPKSVEIQGNPEAADTAVSYPTITATASGNEGYNGEKGEVTFTLKTFDKKEFLYTGELEEMTLLPGRYKLEVYGADGRAAKWEQYRESAQSLPGIGGYAVAEYDVTTKGSIYICVGGNDYHEATNSGGYNGGGLGHNAGKGEFTDVSSCPDDLTGEACTRFKTRNANGGGATHMAVAKQGSGVLKDYKDHQDEVLIVAGGGGGAEWDGMAGAGGGNEGAAGADAKADGANAAGGTQVAGGETLCSKKGIAGKVTLEEQRVPDECTSVSGDFGIGGYAYTSDDYVSYAGGDKFARDYGAGGGGGWYGGGGTSFVGTGGGGSGHLSEKLVGGNMEKGSDDVKANRKAAATAAGFIEPSAYEPYDKGFAKITLLVPDNENKVIEETK